MTLTVYLLRKGAFAIFTFLSAGTLLHAQSETIKVELKLKTGGALSGLVVDSTDHGLVVVDGTTPHVFAWLELQPVSAFETRKRILQREKKEQETLIAEDHRQLGLFALKIGNRDLAHREFAEATQLDPSLKPLVQEIWSDYRKKKTRTDQARNEDQRFEASPDSPPDSTNDQSHTDPSMDLSSALTSVTSIDPLSVVQEAPPDTQKTVLEIYRTFGHKVREVISKNIELIETDHFLIWTDWSARSRPQLAQSCESMYSALCHQFDLDPARNIFLAKCPIFCFRAKSRFKQFARYFDGFDASDSLGYTRSIESQGHVHMVLLRQGDDPSDFERFSATLVHEGTHAFIHRLHSTRLIPHWVNEGCADLMAERVLGNECFTGENSDLLARQFVRYDWPINKLLRSTEPIAVNEYPLAQSVINYLDQTDPVALRHLIRELKEGRTVAEAVESCYNGTNLTSLESGWRDWVRRRDVFFSKDAGAPPP
ncbi:MAG: hypothetical protein AABZ47_05920 [Planctomycetota bacterium]